MSERITRRVVVHGRVQGVGFREFMRREAVRHGVAGWVRNRRDGTVEAMISGPEEAVEAVIAWASHGPPSAQVTSIDVENAEGTFTEFEVRRTE
jgi:acylphosphatase